MKEWASINNEASAGNVYCIREVSHVYTRIIYMVRITQEGEFFHGSMNRC